MKYTSRHFTILTGASSGIGAATAKKLCESNIKTVAIARSKTGLLSTKNNISAEELSQIDNLCITTRSNNSKKHTKHHVTFLLTT